MDKCIATCSRKNEKIIEMIILRCDEKLKSRRLNRILRKYL